MKGAHTAAVDVLESRSQGRCRVSEPGMSMNSHDKKSEHERDALPESIGRRALLKGSVRAMPVVLTLHSGAALARSSNMIGAAPAGTRDMDGNTLCLTTDGSDLVGGKYDLGEPAEGDVNVIPDADFYRAGDDDYDDRDDDDDERKDPVSPDEMCADGGEYMHYYSGRWRQVELPKNGIVVSATALVSVSARGDIMINRIA